MTRITLLLVVCLLFTCTVSRAADIIENPKTCQQCGMDRTMFARSRMLVTYTDGTTAGVCSVHCAAAEIKNNRDKPVKSLLVADYASQELIDARTAIWVVGGDKKGVMTSLPKWAFAGDGAAQKFIREHGGEAARFDQAMQAANEELVESNKMTSELDTHVDHDITCHMGPGAQMVFNPAFGDDIYHTHPAGMWMVNYKFMHTSMSGLRDGTTKVPVERVIPATGTLYGFMMAPTSMTMDMQMVMAMYGVTDRLTLMGMGSYQSMTMDMLMNMGMGSGNVPEAPMRTSGFGDTELRGIYKINDYLVASLGLSIPTGDIKQEFQTMGKTYRAPYDMQLGSGTFDLKPALTYSAVSNDAAWNWGGQASYTNHLGKNNSGYSLGDITKATSWLQRAFGPASAWLRLAYTHTNAITGQDPGIQKLLVEASTPDADANNYGGHRIDGLIGVSFLKGPFSFGVEGGIPLYQNLHGLQLETDWFLTVGCQAMF